LISTKKVQRETNKSRTTQQLATREDENYIRMLKRGEYFELLNRLNSREAAQQLARTTG